jgi:hypothetical protein
VSLYPVTLIKPFYFMEFRWVTEPVITWNLSLK